MDWKDKVDFLGVENAAGLTSYNNVQRRRTTTASLLDKAETRQLVGFAIVVLLAIFVAK